MEFVGDVEFVKTMDYVRQKHTEVGGKLNDKGLTVTMMSNLIGKTL